MRSSEGEALSGIKVLDLCRVVSGPFATMHLGDLGADVVKIEDPRHGDESRRYGPPFIGGESAYFLSVNRNKRSCTVDLRAPAGCDVTTATLNLVDGSGTVLATTSPAADGTYSFAKVAATDAFTVALAGTPSGCVLSGPGTRAVDLRTTDAVADFAVVAAQAAPAPSPTGTATGTVTDRDGDPVEGARVVISGPDGRIAADETGAGGHYAIPDLPAGDLTATLLGTILLIGGFQALTVYGSQYALVAMGVLLVVTVLLAPEGLIMALAFLPGRLFRARARETA